MYRDSGCPDCRAVTSGDCGQHGPLIVPWTTGVRAPFPPVETTPPAVARYHIERTKTGHWTLVERPRGGWVKAEDLDRVVRAKDAEIAQLHAAIWGRPNTYAHDATVALAEVARQDSEGYDALEARADAAEQARDAAEMETTRCIDKLVEALDRHCQQCDDYWRTVEDELAKVNAELAALKAVAEITQTVGAILNIHAASHQVTPL